MIMQVIRQLYEDLPDNISIPIDFQHHKAEIIILSFDKETPVSPQTPIIDLAGGLTNSILATKSPLNLQRKIRNEWH